MASARANEDAAFEVLVIGGGQAGIPLARELARQGKRLALAERRHLGGSCVNFGCTPTKAVIASAKAARLAHRAYEFGLYIPEVQVDFPAVLERAKGILTQFRIGLREGVAETHNLTLIRGHARFEGREGKRFRIRVGDQLVTAAQVVLNTGTRTLIPKIAGLDGIEFLDAGNWLDRPALPKHLAIVGGGFVGLEMAQFYRRMGSQVTVIQDAGQVAEQEDEEISQALQHFLEAEDIAFRLNARVTKVRRRKRGVALTIRQRRRPSLLEASHLFIATGRRPNTDDLGLATIGLRTSKEGFIKTNSRLATTIRGVWAAGDIRGGPMFTHTSWDDYRVLLSQLGGDRSRTVDRIVPYAIYTDPQLGRVGLTEAQARRRARRIKVGRFEMQKNGKARELGDPGGLVKVIADARTRRILGASVLAVEGAELIHVFITLMNARAPYTTIRDAVHIHPTLSEAVQSAVTLLK